MTMFAAVQLLALPQRQACPSTLEMEAARMRSLMVIAKQWRLRMCAVSSRNNMMSSQQASDMQA